MLSWQEEEAERLEALRNDARVLEQRQPQDPIDEQEISERIVERSRRGLRGQQGSTYADHTAIEVNIPGQHGAVHGAPHVVGVQAQPYLNLPKLPPESPWANPNDPDEFWPADRRRREQEAKAALRGASGPAAPVSRARDLFREDPPHIVGSTPVPQYPAAYGQADHSGQEPPLDDNPAFDPVPERGVETSEARDIGGAPSASPDVAAPPFSNKQE